MSVVQDSYFPAPSPLLQALPRIIRVLFFPFPCTVSFQVDQCPRGRWVGRAELFFVIEGDAAALGNDLRPGCKGTHTSLHL